MRNISDVKCQVISYRSCGTSKFVRCLFFLLNFGKFPLCFSGAVAWLDRDDVIGVAHSAGGGPGVPGPGAVP